MGYRVSEVIHHGDHRNERVVELPDLSVESMAELLRESPYNSGSAEGRGGRLDDADREHRERMSRELQTESPYYGPHTTHLGWANYELLNEGDCK